MSHEAQLGRELVELYDIAGRPLPKGINEKNIVEILHRKREKGADLIVSESDNGGDKDVAAIHIINLLNLAENTKPRNGAKKTSHDLSEKEYALIEDAVTKIFPVDKNFVFRVAAGFHVMRHPEERKESQKLQKLYRGFSEFWRSIDPNFEDLLRFHYNSRSLDRALKTKTRPEQEELLDFIAENEKANWRLFYNMGGFWGLVFPQQYVEAMSSKPEQYPVLLKQSDHTDTIIEALAHTAFEGGLDPLEKKILSSFNNQRIQGKPLDFEELRERVSREDLLYYLSINGQLAVFQGIKEDAFEYINAERDDVVDKTKKANCILMSQANPIEGGIREPKYLDHEESNVLTYILESMIGIRGKTNIQTILDKFSIYSKYLAKFQPRDISVVANYIKEPSTIVSCGMKSLEMLAKYNPRIIEPFSAFDEEDNPALPR